MTPGDVKRLLAVVATFDNRRVEDSTVAAWSAVFDGTGITLVEARDAVIAHFRDSTAYLMPAHIVAGARQARRAALPPHTMSERVEDCTALGREHRRLPDGTCIGCEHRIREVTTGDD